MQKALTEEQIKEMLEKRARGATMADLAKEYYIGITTVRRYVNGITRKSAKKGGDTT